MALTNQLATDINAGCLPIFCHLEKAAATRGKCQPAQSHKGGTQSLVRGCSPEGPVTRKYGSPGPSAGIYLVVAFQSGPLLSCFTYYLTYYYVPILCSTKS